ncbi:MAG: F0F1 ATP synthase subunit epsilon [Mycoplasma sp.]
MENQVHLKIFTPQGLVFNENIDFLNTTTISGQIGICANQPSSIFQLKPNVSKVTIGDKHEFWVITDGMIHVEPDLITITTSSCLLKNEDNIKKTNEAICNLKQLLSRTEDKDAISAIEQVINLENLKLNLLSN